MSRPISPLAGRQPDRSTRREFFRRTGLVAAAAALGNAAGLLAARGWLPEAVAQGAPDPLRDALHGLVSFIAPGNDAFSAHQGVSTPEPGGVDAGITEVLIADLDLFVPFLPNFSQTVAAVLNGVAQAVQPGAAGPFAAPFANLTFAEKGTVFSLLESGAIDPALVGLGNNLPPFVAFLAYSEAGAVDPATGELDSTPLGWQLTGYEGVSNGHDEFKGYYQDRKKVN